MHELSSVVAALVGEIQPVIERDLTPDDRDQARILRPHFLHELFGCGRVLRILPEYRAMNVIAEPNPHEGSNPIGYGGDVRLLRLNGQPKMPELISNSRSD